MPCIGTQAHGKLPYIFSLEFPDILSYKLSGRKNARGKTMNANFKFDIVIIVTALLTIGVSIAYGHEMGPGMMGLGYGMGWFWPIIMFFFWSAVIVGIVFLVRWLVLPANKGRESSQEESALEILKKRYAMGEINKEEYEKIKKDIL